MNEIDCIVVGGGVIGLAVARSLALKGLETILVDKEKIIGSHTSSRNSEVIHAGIYYPTGSLKALHCVTGRAMLYAYCEARHIPYRRCGKLIVATQPDQVLQLEELARTARANGVVDLEFVCPSDLLRMEPELKADAALFSPSTGIIDSHAYMTSLAGDFTNAGGIIAFDTHVSMIRCSTQGLAVWIEGSDDAVLRSRFLVNCAGLEAPHLASRIEGLAAQHIPTPYLAKGSYFSLKRRAPFSHLIYPVPEPGGLGTHLTLDLAGSARFGPDVEWVETIDYTVDPAKAAKFCASIRRFWPALREEDLQPAYAGIRPKISGPGDPPADFLISGPRNHGVPGLVNLFGMESPGLTASLAIAEHVAGLIVD